MWIIFVDTKQLPLQLLAIAQFPSDLAKDVYLFNTPHQAYATSSKLNYFMIGEVSSLDYSMIISKAWGYNAPARVSVPGRNGDVLRKPQRFLKSGEIKSRYTADVTLFNPTRYEAKPLICVNGYGSLGVGNDTVTINTHALDYIDLDCSLCDAFCGSSNANGYVSLSGDDYPSLGVGKTGITLGANITAIEVWPNWWTL